MMDVLSANINVKNNVQIANQEFVMNVMYKVGE